MNIQFATFSLLVYYFARRVHNATWDTRTRKIALALYFTANGILLLAQLGISSTSFTCQQYFAVIFSLSFYYYYAWTPPPSDSDSEDYAPVWLETVEDALLSLIFFVLVIILAVYGWLVRPTQAIFRLQTYSHST